MGNQIILTRKKYRSNDKTKKKMNLKIKGIITSKKEGWINIKIYGNPYERGFAHGYLLYDKLKQIIDTFPFIIENEFKQKPYEYIQLCNKLIKPNIKTHFPEFYEELVGISKGAFSKKVLISVDFLIAWNSLLSMDVYYKNVNNNKRCSAFIATGNATQNGDIIMAHNTHCDFITAPFFNINMTIIPEKGNSFIMQTAPGYIASGTDWFISSSGIIGCETTISKITYIPDFKNGYPYFCRIRKAMQYGNTIDDYIEIMCLHNAGDYACSWLFGNINNNEIALFEIGLKHHSVQRTKNGLFYGMNSVLDKTIRESETNDTDLFNETTSSGSRNYLLHQLLNEEYYGKLNIENAKLVLSDHYDSFLNKDIMNANGICKHSEINDDISTHKCKPYGCIDGKVVNSKLAKRLIYIGRFGSSCGRIFNKNDFIKIHPQYKSWINHLVNIPKYKWINITPTEKNREIKVKN